MKFSKRYQEYMQGRRNKGLPGVGLKKLKKLLKSCTTESHSQHHQTPTEEIEDNSNHSLLPHHCPVCDATFFPSLMKEMSAVVDCFNEKAQTLLELHLSSGFRKCILWFSANKLLNNNEALMQEVKNLVTYAIINSAAVRKILKKYDKVHCSKQGETFRSKAQSMYLEILQSPWLCELLAFYLNLRRKGSGQAMDTTWSFGDCSLSVDDGKPVLSYGPFDSVYLQIDLSCSICLETVFDPIALRCGHIFCYMCCCSAASVTIIDGLHSTDPKAKCPLCRRAGVHKGAVNLDELSFLLSQSCPDYWKQRLQTERIERVRQAKEHWESQCRSLMGLCGFKSAVPVDDLLGVCDVIFFPSLLKEKSEVIACFNEKARSLLELHSASRLWNINSAAIRKILHKYNKLNCAKQGEMFKAKTHCMHVEILQSPWLCDLLAFYIYLRRKASGQAMTAPWLFDDCSLSIDDGKPMLSYSLFDSANLEIELSCSICLETVFDAVALRCGHIFCYMCSCSAASVMIIDGMDAVDPKAKCPLCRQIMVAV
ncbi:hypothetical protein J5N97_018240 [Dioscorea zingiberensis]|uniref:RING-type E3 ubiquitin transferase n=1 Tax=Dioscorea zingiberensis TaxID=325984 RepID=A0A9D5HH28_9LILI|nr:hypothetical protein J5N97_018240 [Dioscorea zingiberensis]